MPQKKVRYGYSIRPRFLGEQDRVLMGKKAHRIITRVRNLTHAFAVKPDGSVTFMRGIKANMFDSGAHGKIYLIEEPSLAKLGLAPHERRHFVLKVYRPSAKTNGLTQYASIFAVYNYLKKKPLKHVRVLSPPIFAGGEKFLVTELVNKPTLTAIMAFFRRKRNPAEQHMIEELEKEGIVEKEYFPKQKIPEFVLANGITEELVQTAYAELSKALREGELDDFGSGLYSNADLKTKNFFVYGAKNHKLLVSVSDQGTIAIPNLMKLLEKNS